MAEEPVAEEPMVDGEVQTAGVFVPVAPDAVRMCLGPCGEAKPSTAFPIMRGKPDARRDECRACRDDPFGSTTLAAPGEGRTEGKYFPAGGRREQRRAERQIVAELVGRVVRAHVSVALTISQVYNQVACQVEFPPSETDVRNSLRDLAKSDARLVKLSRDTYAWAADGAVPLPPPPMHVVQMIERRRRGHTLGEIGSEFGVTRERVRQLLKKYGGPSSEEVRALRASEVLSARREHEEAVAAQIRGALARNGPMTVAEVVGRTGVDPGDVAKYWPQELAHLRLWGGGRSESRWSDEDILVALREASLYEFPLTTTAYSDLLQVGQVTGPSVPRIGQRFGSWSAACAAAGVVAGDPWNRDYESRWSDEELRQIARSYLLDPTAPSSARRFDEWKRDHAPDGPSAQTLRNRFGSWTEVKRRALAQEGLHE